MSVNSKKSKIIKIAIFEDDCALRNMLIKMIEAKSSRSEYCYDISAYEDPSFCPFFERNCKKSKNIIESDGCCACDGIACSREKPCVDIIITDVNMPNVNGVDFIKAQLSNGCKVKNILFISGELNEETISKIDAMGGRYLHKPFSIYDLYGILDIFESEMI